MPKPTPNKAVTKGGTRKGAGAPLKMKDGKRVNVYLDASSLKAAVKIGSGNVSEGIRKALQNYIDESFL